MIYLGVIFLIILMSLLVSYLNKVSNKNLMPDTNGVLTLRMHGAWKALGVILVIFSMVIVILGIYTVESTEDIVIVICLTIFFLAMGIYLMLIAANYRFEVDEQGIKYHGILNKSGKVFWEQIKDVRLNKAGSFVIFCTDDETVKIFIRLAGFSSFTGIASRKLDEDLYKRAFIRLKRYGLNVSDNEVETVEDKVRREFIVSRRVKSSANWFYWIAGLSLINTFIVLTNGSINFVVGLGLTQVVDGFAYYFSNTLGTISIVIGVMIDILISSFFVLLGFKSGKGIKWSFIVGMVLYSLDGLIFLYLKDFVAIGFHIFALYNIFVGYRTMIKTNNEI